MKPCYLKMCDSSYGLMYYPDREHPLDLYFAKRPHVHEGYKVCFEVPKKHQEFLDEKVKDYQERYSNKPMPNSDINHKVIDDAYGFTIDKDGEVNGLINGDMGYERTGIILDDVTKKIWLLGVEAYNKEKR